MAFKFIMKKKIRWFVSLKKVKTASRRIGMAGVAFLWILMNRGRTEQRLARSLCHNASRFGRRKRESQAFSLWLNANCSKAMLTHSPIERKAS
mmetsp:Transcript_9798/g.20266  ORF Transcript_9798/g.20266 Transcript_9798/m.20266 type:complete len:93 (+) Transcript_9798:726-1004(+)